MADVSISFLGLQRFTAVEQEIFADPEGSDATRKSYMQEDTIGSAKQVIHARGHNRFCHARNTCKRGYNKICKASKNTTDSAKQVIHARGHNRFCQARIRAREDTIGSAKQAIHARGHNMCMHSCCKPSSLHQGLSHRGHLKHANMAIPVDFVAWRVLQMALLKMSQQLGATFEEVQRELAEKQFLRDHHPMHLSEHSQISTSLDTIIPSWCPAQPTSSHHGAQHNLHHSIMVPSSTYIIPSWCPAQPTSL
jgi:hypothetical protein